MSLESLLERLANVPAVPDAEIEREHSKSLNINDVPDVPDVPGGSAVCEVEEASAVSRMPVKSVRRPIAHFRLSGGKGGGTLIGRIDDTFQDLQADLCRRYWDCLSEIKEGKWADDEV